MWIQGKKRTHDHVADLENKVEMPVSIAGSRFPGLLYSQSIRSTAGNPLQLDLGDIGVDNGAVLFCYGQKSTPCNNPDGAAYVDSNDTSSSSARFSEYRYAGPVYVTVDIPNTVGGKLHYNLDGSGASCSGSGVSAQNCGFYHNGDLAAQLGRAVTYGGKTRIVLYAVSSTAEQTQGWVDDALPNLLPCSNVAAWICGSDSVPNKVSVLNVTTALSSISKFQLTQSTYDDPGETLGPLEPGPTVRIRFIVSKRFSDEDLVNIRRRACAVVWNISADSEKCEWQVWATVDAGANVEEWSDESVAWVMSNNGIKSNSAAWTVTLNFLAESNSYADWIRYKITTEVNTEEFAVLYHLISMVNVTTSGDSGALTNYKQYFAHVTAPAPSKKRGIDSIYGCSTHYECSSGLFCSFFALRTWNGADVFVGSSAACDDCRTCLDSGIYTIAGSCPEDKCGPRVGTYPQCWDSDKLLVNYTCLNVYQLNLSAIQGVDKGAADVSALLAKPKSLRARFLTPFNRLIGAVIIRQKRIQQADTSSVNVCSLPNDTVAKYSSAADPSRGLICLGTLPDNTFYGTDPAFAQFSSLYDGKLNAEDYYNSSEFANLSAQSPFGFFPHRYDYNTGNDKSVTLFAIEADNFLVFMDERISSKHAQEIITYLNDGNFLDQQTREITVEMNTLNAANKMYCKFIFKFTWQVHSEYECQSFKVRMFRKF